MKYITGIGLLWFCLIFMFKNAQEGRGGQAPHLISAVPSDMCICFEYYFKHLSKSERTIYQSCDSEVLDYNEDHSMEIFTLNVPCDNVFEGTKIITSKNYLR